VAGLYKRGAAWYLSWVESGRQRRRSLGAVTRAEAETARRAKEAQLGAVAGAGPSFAEWAQVYAEWHAQEYPDSYYRVEQILRCHLIPAFGDTPLAALTRDAAEAYKAERLAKVSGGTAQKEWRTLQALLNRAVELGRIDANPLAHVRGPRNLRSRPPRWYTAEELQAIYTRELGPHQFVTDADRDLHMRYRWTWQLMANTGLRRGEAQQLQWQDVAGDELRVVSDEHARTKSGRWRVVPISPGASEALEGLSPVGRRRGPVLPPTTPQSLTRAFGRTLKRLDLDGSLHCLRHTYCSHLVQAGVPLRVVQQLAGHAHHSTTERYAHLAPANLASAAAQLRL
jgi:integrase